MKIDDELLGRLEKLSMIRIEEDRREEFKRELSDIVKKMNELQEVDTSAVVLRDDRVTPMREDCVARSDAASSVLKSAPNARDGYFVVPKIIG